MANLPPRPESPPRIRDDRRYPTDDRERRPAQPMSSRYRGDRYSDERVYVPRPRRDTYIAPGFEPRREIETRRAEYDDRDRDRHHRDRDRRNWGHERDGGPRRWESGLDRDRRPHDRDRNRPPLSPQRRPVSRRFSRSPPRRRPPSPLYRTRPRSRSHSPRHSPPPSKRFRHGNYSDPASPRSRSPHHKKVSRDRSRSRSQVHPENEAKIKSRATSPDTIQVEPSNPLPTSEAHMVEDHEQLLQPHAAEIDVKAPLSSPSDTLTLNQTIRNTRLSPSQDDIKPEIRVASFLEVSSTDDQRIIEKTESTSHKPSPQSPMAIKAQRTPSPPRLPRSMHENTRVLPTAPQRNWPSRSPPRAPRSHPRQSILPSSTPSYASSAPRAPRWGVPPIGSSSLFSSPTPIASRHNPESKKNTKLLDPDLDIYRAQANRSHLTFDHLQRTKNLRRALHELDLATIDLRAAEIRRHIADVQLEQAKNGALGIDTLSVAKT